LELETLLGPGANDRLKSFSLSRRGWYRAGAAALEFRDVLGFTRGRLRVELNEELRVFPTVLSPEQWLARLEVGGEEEEHLKKRRRSEELLEVRKYYPGDDLRRINWKVYAHLGELFLRIGEETPPPQSRFLIALDSSANPALPAPLAGDYLDGLVEACLGLMNILLLKGLQVQFCWSGGGSPKSFQLEKRNELLALLSELWWSQDPALELPARRGLHVILFSSPGSSALPGLVETLRSRGWALSLYLKRLDYYAEPGRRSLRDLLFLPAAGGRGKEAKRLAAAAEAFNRGLQEELARYRLPAWRLANVGVL